MNFLRWLFADPERHHCAGNVPDYQCEGWRQRAAKIRLRDGYRCRCCGRKGDGPLQVHHRVYGRPGLRCGHCILTGVSDEDLISVCSTCHEAITYIRRDLRMRGYYR